MRRRTWLLILLSLVLLMWFFNVSRPGRRVSACLDGCANGAPAADLGELRVVSLNILHGIPSFEHLDTRLDLLTTELRRLDADIIALQEVPWRLGRVNLAAELAKRLDMNYAYIRANGNRWAIGFEEGEAILSRYPLRSVAYFEIKPQAGFFEHRVVLTAILETAFGSLPVVATHLTHSNPQANQMQLAALQAYVDGLPTPALVMGDLNARPDSAGIMTLAADWVDSYPSANPGQAGYTCCVDDLQADPETAFKTRIDYLFLVPDAEQKLTLASSQVIFGHPFQTPVGWLWASDHGGLLTEFSIAP